MHHSEARTGEPLVSVDERPVGESKGDARAAVDPMGLINLFIVYLAYGSTYLAIRVAVRPGGGFSPFTLGFMRLMLAGVILLAWGAFRRKRMLPKREEWFVLIGSGILFWTLGSQSEIVIFSPFISIVPPFGIASPALIAMNGFSSSPVALCT